VQSKKRVNAAHFFPPQTVSLHCLQGLDLPLICCGTVLRVRFPTEPQSDLLEAAHLFEKEEVQEDNNVCLSLHPSATHNKLSTLYQHLSSTVPISLPSLPASVNDSVFISPSPLWTPSTACHFSANRLQSPSRVSNHRLSTRDSDLSQIRHALSDLTGCRRLGSPTLSCTLQHHSTNQLPNTALACCNSLASPAFSFDSKLQECCRHLALPTPSDTL